MNRTFDTDVQLLKYKVLKAVSKRAFDGTLTQGYYDIPKEIIPGKKATMRCCVYKERAILAERVHMAMGGNPDNPNVIEVIDIACDECPVHKVSVTESSVPGGPSPLWTTGPISTTPSASPAGGAPRSALTGPFRSGSGPASGAARWGPSP